jgi:predicted O-methyltransferase YrrM
LPIELRNRLFPAWAYFKFWLLQEDQFSIQSPFVFEIYNGLIGYIQEKEGHFNDILKVRRDLLNDNEVLKIEDFGAGSKRVPGKFRKVKDVAKYSTSRPHFSMLYQFFCNRTPAKVVLELGTCLGINTRFMAEATKGKLYTFEGSKALIEKAKEAGSPGNTEYILGEISQTLPDVLGLVDHVDFALIDATHTYEATIQYFETILEKSGPKSIIAIADIHWSAEMEKAWQQIRHHPRVSTTIDFYECGVIFLNTKLTKAHYVLKF